MWAQPHSIFTALSRPTSAHAGVRRPRLKPSFSLISRSQHQTPTGFLSSDEMAPRTQWACHCLKDNTAPPDCTIFLQTRLFQLPALTMAPHSPHHPTSVSSPLPKSSLQSPRVKSTSSTRPTLPSPPVLLAAPSPGTCSHFVPGPLQETPNLPSCSQALCLQSSLHRDAVESK